MKQKANIIPEQLQKNKFRFNILKKKDKSPIENNWQDKNSCLHYEDKLLKHIEKGGNYGIIGGYGGLVIIDSDSLEVTEIAEKLKPTFTIKTGSKEEYKKHYFFIVEGKK